MDWWRERIVTALLGLASILGAAAYFPGMLLAVSEGRYIIGLVDTAALALLIFLFFSKKISYRIKALVMITASMLLGMTLLISVGFYGAGYLWLFSCCLLTGVIWGFPYIAIIIGISMAILIGMGIAVDQKLLWWIEVDNATEKWLVVTSNFFFLVAMLTTGVSVLIRGFPDKHDQGNPCPEGSGDRARPIKRHQRRTHRTDGKTPNRPKTPLAAPSVNTMNCWRAYLTPSTPTT